MFSVALDVFKATPQRVIIADLKRACSELTGRGLLHSAKWAAELLCGISSGHFNRQTRKESVPNDEESDENVARVLSESRISSVCDAVEQYIKHPKLSPSSSSMETEEEEEVPMEINRDFCDPIYIYAKTLFDMREYRRCAFHLEKLPAANKAGTFLRCYALYLAGERRKNEELSELRIHPATLISAAERDDGSGITALGNSAKAPPMPANKELAGIAKILDATKSAGPTGTVEDGFYWYMKSIVLKERGLKKEARDCLIKSINLFPCNYSAWKDLVKCSCAQGQNEQILCSGVIKSHWSNVFLFAELTGKFSVSGSVGDSVASGASPPSSLSSSSTLPQVSSGELFNTSLDLCETLPTSAYYLTELGRATQAARMDLQTIRVLEAVHKKLDPFCLDKMDVLSNAYFNTQNAPELSKLAQDVYETDKFRAESCIVAGNYFSLKENSAEAIRCFDRAAHLDPTSPAPLLLLGHESVILKKYSSAIRAYRLALEVDPADYRAWYGLALAYRDLKQPTFGLYYALKACSICPDDSRMWVCAGSYYNALGNTCMALHAFVRAYSYDPQDQNAIAELANLFTKLGLSELANGFCELNVSNGVDVAKSLFFMAKFAEKQGLVDDALRLYSKIADVGNAEDRERSKQLKKELQDKKGNSSNNNNTINKQLTL